MAWLTVDEFKKRQTIDGSSFDTVIGNMITRVETWLKHDYFKRTYFEQPPEPEGEGDQNITQNYSGDGSDVLFTDDYPIQFIKSLTIKGSSVTEDEEIPARPSPDNDGYVILSPEFGIIQLDGYTLTEGILNIELQYIPGHDPASIPGPLVEAVYRIASLLWNQQKTTGFQNLSTEGFSRAISENLLDAVTEGLLSNYRRPRGLK